MAFDDMDMDEMDLDAETTPPPEESSNRTFLLVAGILGAITVLALICIVVYAFFFVPRRNAQQATQVAEVNFQNTQVADALTQTAAAAAFTSTPTATATQPAATATRTPTPVVAVPTNTTVPTQDPRTATVAALLTQAAGQSTLAATSTALPDTGFVEDVGIPGLLGMAVLLVAVIFLARRLRTA